MTKKPTELEQAKAHLTECRTARDEQAATLTKNSELLAGYRKRQSELENEIEQAAATRSRAANDLANGVITEQELKRVRIHIAGLKDELDEVIEIVEAFERALEQGHRKLADLNSAAASAAFKCWRALSNMYQSRISDDELIWKAWAARIESGGQNDLDTLGRIICGAIRGEETIYRPDPKLKQLREEMAKEHGL